MARPAPNPGPPPTGPDADAAAAIEELARVAGGRLHGVALRLCRNRADADDLVQDVFLQALRKWHTFRGDADPTTWLYAIAARACGARRRRERREQQSRSGLRSRATMASLMPWSETTVTRLAAAAEDAADDPERAAAVARVQEQIARLPEHLRVVVVLKEVLERSVAETAQALGLEQNTVKTRLHRARLALRRAMTAGAPAVEAPQPLFERQVCLDLLKAKLAAMDRGGAVAGFAVPQADVCARCRAVFRELDLVQAACGALGEGRLPPELLDRILRAVAARDGAERRSPRRGRRPVRGERAR